MTFASDEVAAVAENPVVADALAARGKLDEAFAAQDIEAVAALFAKDLVVNTPANRVARRDAVLGFFKAGRMDYESTEGGAANARRGDSGLSARTIDVPAMLHAQDDHLASRLVDAVKDTERSSTCRPDPLELSS